MSDAQSPFDAYAPPQQHGYEPPSKALTGGVKAICIIALILGGLGMGKSLLGGVGLAFGTQMQQAFTPPQPPNMDPRMKDLQEEMQADVEKIAARYLPFTIMRVVFHFVVATLLVVGAVLALKSSGATVLVVACASAVVFEIGRAILDTTIQLQIAGVMSRFMQRMMQLAPGGQGPSPESLGRVFVIAFYAFAGIGLLFVLAKIVFYAISVFVLRKANPAASTP